MVEDVFLQRPGAELRGSATGSGPTVLLLHAGGERRDVWAPIADALATDGFRTVSFDLRGHGASAGVADRLEPLAGDIAAMVDAEPPGCVVVGASLGGLAALLALREAAVRDRVAGLVLVDVVADPDPDRARRYLADAGILEARRPLVDDVLSHAPTLRRVTADLTMPTKLVRGDPGSPGTVRDDDVTRLRALAPHATVVTVPGASHLVARDRPDALGQAIAMLAASTRSRRQPARRRAVELLRSLGAEETDHLGGSLLAHLERTEAILRSWAVPDHHALAGLCHAAYGTDGFPDPLMPPDDRALLARAIGSEAEAVVYLYGSCDRSATYPTLGHPPARFRDRFTGKDHVADGDMLRAFAHVTVANELELTRRQMFDTATVAGIAELFDSLRPYTPHAGDAADELRATPLGQ